MTLTSDPTLSTPGAVPGYKLAQISVYQKKTHMNASRTKLICRNDGKSDVIDIVTAKVNVIQAFENIFRSVYRRLKETNI